MESSNKTLRPITAPFGFQNTNVILKGKVQIFIASVRLASEKKLCREKKYRGGGFG